MLINLPFLVVLATMIRSSFAAVGEDIVAAAHVAYFGPQPSTEFEMNPACNEDGDCKLGSPGWKCVDYGYKIVDNGHGRVCDCVEADPNCQPGCCCLREHKESETTMKYIRWSKEGDSCRLENGELCPLVAEKENDKCRKKYQCKKFKGSQKFGFCRRSSAPTLSSLPVVIFTLLSLTLTDLLHPRR